MAVNCDCLCISYFLFILLPRKLSFNANSNKDSHYIREQKAIPSVRTSCINTCVSIGIIPASIFGSGSSSKYCLYRAWNKKWDDVALNTTHSQKILFPRHNPKVVNSLPDTFCTCRSQVLLPLAPSIYRVSPLLLKIV